MYIYSLEDSDYLIKHYSPLIIGKVVEKTTQAKVKWLEKDPGNDGLFRVDVITTGGISGMPQLRKSIDLVATYLKIDPPALVLSHRNRPQ